MANTRKSTKRAKQADKRAARNQIIRGQTKSALKGAIIVLQGKKKDEAKDAYMSAVKALSKAASKGGMPARRAARKISRLTLLAKKSLPEVFAK